MIEYSLLLLLLLACELVYFKIAGSCGIIAGPLARSSHSGKVLSGGGVIFTLGIWLWSARCLACGEPVLWWFLAGLTLSAGISLVDDIRSLPNSVRLVAQFVAMGLMFCQLDILHYVAWWGIVASLIVCVGAANIYNFMDGINGMTAGYSLSVLVPLFLLNRFRVEPAVTEGFVSESLIVVTILATLVFSFFNFRPKGKAKCFAGDVGSVGMAFILLFMIGSLIVKTGDVTWLTFLIVYGVDGCLTICHRIMLHEHLGEAHRKHMYQLMSNELGMSHVVVSLIYMAVQMAISLVMVYLIPNTALAHWIYLLAVIVVLALVYLVFMKKYYHLHEKSLSLLSL